MKLSQVKAAAIAALKANVPVCLEGPPGVGKSEVVPQLQQALWPAGWTRVFNPALHDPTDIVGMPSVQDGRSIFGRPSLLPEENAGPGIFFMDEVGQAAPLMQAACMKITLENIAGTHRLPAECRRVLATNRVEDRAGVSRLLTPLANRVCRIQVDADADEWVEWAGNNNVDPRVIGFIKFKPTLIYNFDPKADQGSFATPRSWVMTSKVLAHNPDQKILFDVVKGCVGQAAAIEFKGFLDVWGRLPSTKDMIAQADTFILPSANDISLTFALVENLIHASRSQDPTVVDACLRIAMRLPDDFGLKMAIGVCGSARKIAAGVPSFTKAVAKFQQGLTGRLAA